MCNSQINRIGRCRWPMCNCQHGEIGAYRNGSYLCSNCGHELNDHEPINNTNNNYNSPATPARSSINNAASQPYHPLSLQHRNFNYENTPNQSHMHNHSSLNYPFSGQNSNRLNLLAYNRSPLINSIFDSIRCNSLITQSHNNIPSNVTNNRNNANLNTNNTNDNIDNEQQQSGNDDNIDTDDIDFDNNNSCRGLTINAEFNREIDLTPISQRLEN